jgi:serine/threonine protein kinase
MAPQVVKKSSYSYKADIWSLGVILYELLNATTPFHSKSRAEFESKVEVSKYTLKDTALDKITIEGLMFLSHCLQDNEDERKCISELVKHPYITTAHDSQNRITNKLY